MLEALIQDVKYGSRSLLNARAFSAIVIVTLALGSGANTAVFSVLNAAVLRPLPYANPDRLVRIYLTYRGDPNYIPGPALLDFQQQSATLDIAPVYSYAAEGADLTDRPRPERVNRLEVGANYFRVLGTSPIAGGPFAASDEHANAAVAVVSERLWREYLGGMPDAIGKTVSLNGVAHRVLGVMPDGFQDPLMPGIEVWTPIDLQEARRNSWSNNYLSAIGRLRPGRTLAEARAELATLAGGQQSHYRAERRTALVVPLQADIVGTSGRLLWTLLGAVGLLLLIACVNVASLFLARGAARESELAVRIALGCSRTRLVRQALIESVMLSLAGGAAGLLLAALVSRILLAAAPAAVAGAAHGGFDGAVFTFSVAVALVAGLAFGVAPAVQFTRPDIDAVLRESGRGTGGSRRQTRARNVLVVCQVALALVLLIGAGLLLRTFDRLRAVDLGLQPDNILTFEVHLPDGRYADPAARTRFHVEFERRLAALPGARAAAAVSRLPVTGPFHTWGTRRVDRSPDQQRGVQPQQRVIEGDYFRALGIPLLRGRTFGPADDERAPRRVVVSASLVKALFGDENPLGHQLNVAGEQPIEIIGVVGDVPIARRTAPPPFVYHSHRQFAADRNWALTGMLAVDRVSPALLSEVRRELAAVDPSLVLFRPRMLTDVIGGGLAGERFALLLIGAFALVAVMLAGIGIYGVLSYSVSRRLREIGIRLALGAQPSAVRRLIVGDGGRLALLGIAAGVAGALLATRGLGSLLYNVSATDPAVFITASAVLAIVALAASWFPARVASRADPLEAFRP